MDQPKDPLPGSEPKQAESQKQPSLVELEDVEVCEEGEASPEPVEEAKSAKEEG